MKRFLSFFAAMALLLSGSVSAQAQTGSGSPFSVAAGLSAGVVDGIGGEIAVGVTDRINVRAGYSVFPNMFVKEYSISLPAWGSNPASETAFTGKGSNSANVLVDFHPVPSGSFHVTAGVFFGPDDFVKVFNTKALPESYHAAGVNYYLDEDKDDITKYYRIRSDEKGIMNASLKTMAFRPYVGLGFGSAIPRHRVGGLLDLGVEYTGGLDLRADAVSIKGETESIPITTGGVLMTVKEMRKQDTDKAYYKYFDYIDQVRSLPLLPFVRFSFFVKLF